MQFLHKKGLAMPLYVNVRNLQWYDCQYSIIPVPQRSQRLFKEELSQKVDLKTWLFFNI